MPLAQALISANRECLVWGTDWPHPDSVTPPGKAATDVTPLLRIDDGAVLNQFAVWALDAAVRKAILVDNPVRLYGFRQTGHAGGRRWRPFMITAPAAPKLRRTVAQVA